MACGKNFSLQNRGVILEVRKKKKKKKRSVPYTVCSDRPHVLSERLCLRGALGDAAT